MSEKTHKPSAQRIREARKKGQIPKSTLLTSAAATLGGLMGTLPFAGETARRLTGWTTSLLRDGGDPMAALYEGLWLFGRSAARSLAGAFIAALVSQVALAGLQVNAEHVLPKLERLDFAAGAKKLFTVRKLVDLLKGLVVTALLALILWRGVVAAAPLALRAVAAEGGPSLIALLELWRPIVLRAGLVLAALGLGDQLLARRKHLKDLMMTHQELKQEHKSSEGDPHTKGKRKSLHRQLASGGSARGLEKATVVVINPTHIAVALRYDEAECEAPYIVAKGRKEDALKLRRAAESLEIPVVCDVPLARALVHYDVGEEIAQELYQAAAAVLQVALAASDGRDAVHAVLEGGERP